MDLLTDPETRRVALVRLRVGLGDLLCSLPAWRALRTARPDLHVTVITYPEMAPLIARMRGYVDELLPFPGHPGIPERPPVAEQWQPFVAAAAARRFDLALQTYGDRPAANDVTAALGARHIGGFAARGAVITRDHAAHLDYPRDRHEVHRHLAVLAHLGVPVTDADAALEFPAVPDDVAGCERLMAETGLRTAEFAVLHPGASAASRRWPADRFAAVGDALAARGLRVVVGGVAAEAGIVAAVRDSMTADAVDVAGRTGVGAYAELVRRAALVVCNDTGTAHVAAAVGTPAVVIFLSGDALRWAHRLPTQRAALVPVGCNGCGHLQCPIDFRCATWLSVSDVLARADELLG
ncbi:glycosyltransferase family 9 protein [Mycobacterium sp. MYCO198283]|uniref:glycosyltransferase family 9 protein n=1 Tax=Mycobacterium sp. MYCO198283 TaxID=2883505 RepID=UPI001E3F3BB3|nr:glycosyltransferase family 9 protein [Mycobacterium sp. MYCO198283]MCG5434124.1 glycosyltransferase family 9 protein [Mycobacterium sp. MYCO198283]